MLQQKGFLLLYFFQELSVKGTSHKGMSIKNAGFSRDLEAFGTG